MVEDKQGLDFEMDLKQGVRAALKRFEKFFVFRGKAHKNKIHRRELDLLKASLPDYMVDTISERKDEWWDEAVRQERAGRPAAVPAGHRDDERIEQQQEEVARLFLIKAKAALIEIYEDEDHKPLAKWEALKNETYSGRVSELLQKIRQSLKERNEANEAVSIFDVQMMLKKHLNVEDQRKWMLGIRGAEHARAFLEAVATRIRDEERELKTSFMIGKNPKSPAKKRSADDSEEEDANTWPKKKGKVAAVGSGSSSSNSNSSSSERVLTDRIAELEAQLAKQAGCSEQSKAATEAVESEIKIQNESSFCRLHNSTTHGTNVCQTLAKKLVEARAAARSQGRDPYTITKETLLTELGKAHHNRGLTFGQGYHAKRWQERANFDGKRGSSSSYRANKHDHRSDRRGFKERYEQAKQKYYKHKDTIAALHGIEESDSDMTERDLTEEETDDGMDTINGVRLEDKDVATIKRLAALLDKK